MRRKTRKKRERKEDEDAIRDHRTEVGIDERHFRIKKVSPIHVLNFIQNNYNKGR